MNGCARGFLIWVVVLTTALVTGEAMMRVWGVRWYIAGPIGILFGCGVVVLAMSILSGDGGAQTTSPRGAGEGHPQPSPAPSKEEA